MCVQLVFKYCSTSTSPEILCPNFTSHLKNRMMACVLLLKINGYSFNSGTEDPDCLYVGRMDE